MFVLCWESHIVSAWQLKAVGLNNALHLASRTRVSCSRSRCSSTRSVAIAAADASASGLEVTDARTLYYSWRALTAVDANAMQNTNTNALIRRCVDGLTVGIGGCVRGQWITSGTWQKYSIGAFLGQSVVIPTWRRLRYVWWRRGTNLRRISNRR